MNMGNSYKWEAKKISDLYTDVNIAEQASKSDVNKQPDFVTYKEPKSMFHSEASNRIITPPGFKRDNDKRIITPEDIPYIGYMPSSKKKLPKYPFINFKAFAENNNGMKLPLYYIANKITKPVRESMQSYVMAGGDFFTNVVLYPAVNTIENWTGQQFHTKSQEVLPKIRAWYDFSEGASTINKLYTISHTVSGVTREFPVFATEPGDVQPTDDKLEKGIRTTIDENRSSMNGDISNFYRKQFSLIAAEKYTRSDFAKLEDPMAFRKWFVRDDTWIIQQYGNRDLTLEKDLIVDGNTHHVYVYDRPSDFLTWLYWAVGDKVYDFIDGFYDPLQSYMEGKIPPQAEQIMIRDEYKAIARVRRGLFNSARTPLEYDMT